MFYCLETLSFYRARMYVILGYGRRARDLLGAQNFPKVGMSFVWGGVVVSETFSVARNFSRVFKGNYVILRLGKCSRDFSNASKTLNVTAFSFISQNSFKVIQKHENFR